MTERNRPHIILPTRARSEPFTIPTGGGGTDGPGFSGDRHRHGSSLLHQYETALATQDKAPEVAGAYISFRSFPGLELALESLDVQRVGEQPELVAVRETASEDGPIQVATVYIPDGKKEYFLKRLAQYVASSGQDKARNATLVEGIQSIHRATIRELWTDSDEAYPTDSAATRW